MRDANRTQRVVPGAGTCCIALIVGLCLAAVVGGSTPARAQASREATSEDRRQWWITDQWTITGETIAWRDGWMRVDGAVAYRETDGPDGSERWTLRADRLEVRPSPTSPRTIAAVRARGDVRLIGPSPIYVAGRRAMSFRPGRSWVVWSPVSSSQPSPPRPAEPRLVGDGWTLVGTHIAVDLLDRRVTVDEVTSTAEADRGEADVDATLNIGS